MFTYYVTNDLTGDWRRLPDIKPKQILASRSIKQMFSGNAGAKVITHPFFEGTEEVMLRAQIARISADTRLCITGYLKREDDEDLASPIVQNEEFSVPVLCGVVEAGSLDAHAATHSAQWPNHT